MSASYVSHLYDIMRILGHGIVSKEVLLFIARLTFESGRNPVVCVTIQMKPLLVEFSHGAIYFSSNFVVLTFESLNEILWCDHSNDTSSAVYSNGTI